MKITPSHLSSRGLSLLASLILALMTAHATPSRAQIDVWVDPGHGGVDPGNIGFGGTQEKTVTQGVANQLINRLAAAGYSALLTHTSDSLFPTLNQRAAIANGNAPNNENQQEECQLFISIHMNAPKGGASEPGPFGTETYYSPRKSRLKKKTAYRADSTLAEAVHPRLMTGAAAAFIGCNRDRGIKAARHAVTRQCERPSLLIEVCFITNQCQRNNIITAGDQALVAQGIASGVSFAISPGGGSPGQVDATAAQPWDPPSASQGGVNGTAGVWPRSVNAYSEGFEGGSFPPTGWTATTLGLAIPHRWHRVTDGIYVHGGIAAALVGGESPGPVDEWLISPTVFLGPTDRGLKFRWSANQTWALSVNNECLVRPVGEVNWTSAWSLQNEPPGAEFDYRERGVDLTSWLGDSIQVAFRAVGTNGADFSIDDVAIGDFLPTAAPANDLCANALDIYPGSFSITGTTCYASNAADPSDPTGASCSIEALGGSDVFYEITALPSDTLDVTLMGSAFPVAYLLSACDTALASCLAATSALQTAGGDTTLLHHVFASAGTYYLVVDGFTGECGEFQIEGSFRGPVTGVEPWPGSRAQIRALPNPFRSSVRVQATLQTGLTGEATATVYDAAGRRVLSRPVPVVDGQAIFHWSGEDESGSRMPPGIYLVRISHGAASVTTRLAYLRET